MTLRSADFESAASASSAIPALGGVFTIYHAARRVPKPAACHRIIRLSVSGSLMGVHRHDGRRSIRGD